jgi:sialate O-acetylesterase
MKKSCYFLSILMIGISFWPGIGIAQYHWPDNCKAAVCLTYDDAWDNHLDIVAHQLDSLGLKATFYIPGHSPYLFHRIDDWRQLARSGHELGNHSLFHPCNWADAGMTRPYGHGDLALYSFEQLITELKTANTLLKAIDGNDSRTYAYTCGNYHVQKLDFSDSLSHLFTAARAAGPIPDDMKNFNVFKTPSWCVPEFTTAKELISYAKEALDKGTIAIYMFHSIGGQSGHGWFNVDAAEHMKFLQYIRDHAKDYYCSTFMEVMEYIRTKGK